MRPLLAPLGVEPGEAWDEGERADDRERCQERRHE